LTINEAELTPPNLVQIDPADDVFWSGIRSQFSVSSDFINLENGFFGIPAKPVLDAFENYNGSPLRSRRWPASAACRRKNCSLSAIRPRQ
jgi:hypothetical protein